MFFKKKNKYDVKPEENIPAKLYGVYLPEEDTNQNNDYDVQPQDNIPVDLYGVYLPKDEDDVNNKYNVEPQDNNPQILYGPMPIIEAFRKDENNKNYIPYRDNNFNQETTIILQIGENNLQITLSSRYPLKDDSNYLKIAKNKQTDSIEVEIPIDTYNNYQQRILSITSSWPQAIGNRSLTPNKEIKEWQLEITNADFSVKYNALKEVPNNWHDFMLLINEMVKRYEVITKDLLKDEEYKNKLTKLIKANHNDPFWQSLYLDYFLNHIKNHEQAYYNYQILSNHPEINNEFSKYLVSVTYDYLDQITINGYNVKRIHTEHPDYSAINIFLIMCNLVDRNPKE